MSVLLAVHKYSVHLAYPSVLPQVQGMAYIKSATWRQAVSTQFVLEGTSVGNGPSTLGSQQPQPSTSDKSIQEPREKRMERAILGERFQVNIWRGYV